MEKKIRHNNLKKKKKHFNLSSALGTYKESVNPRLIKLLFVTRLTKWGFYNPLPRF